MIHSLFGNETNQTTFENITENHRLIPLSLNGLKFKGMYYTIVDKQHYIEYAKFKISVFKLPNTQNKYAMCINQFLHRLIMGVTDSKTQVDHINGNTLDNRTQNLRICTQAQNNRNQRKIKNTKFKYKGLKEVKVKKWKYIQASIMINGKQIYIGTFKTEIEAAKAYDEAALKYFGEYAKLNFPINDENKNQEQNQNPNFTQQ